MPTDALPDAAWRQVRARRQKAWQGRREASRRFLWWFAVPLTATLLLLGLWTLPIRLLQLPGDPIFAAMLAYEPVNRSGLEHVEAGRAAALDWHTNAASLEDLATLDYIRAKRGGLARPQAQDFMAKSLAWQTQALARSPADPFGWAQLVNLDLYRQPPDPTQAVSALKLSLETGLYERQLAVPRLDMMTKLWDALDPETRKFFPELVRTAWKVNPWGVADIAMNNHFTGLMGEALANDSDARAKFDRMVNP